jgi:hypothetical protein
MTAMIEESSSSEKARTSKKDRTTYSKYKTSNGN